MRSIAIFKIKGSGKKPKTTRRNGNGIAGLLDKTQGRINGRAFDAKRR
jgi:hypothetical protein